MNEGDESLKESEMKEKLKKIFHFLEKNRRYNIEIQGSFFNSVFNNKKSEKEKLISLLYFIAETQSQGKIDKLSESYQIFHNSSLNYDTWSSFCDTLAHAIPVDDSNAKKYLKMTEKKKAKHIEVLKDNTKPFSHLFNTIKNYPGFGDKTAALFVKMIYQIHFIDGYTKYKIWKNVSPLASKDMLYLPVDAVIIEIFKKISPPTDGSWNFKRINTKLNELYQGSDIEIWDDLWFWGYITQKVVKNQDDRDFELNKAKYWVMKESNKTEQTINEIFKEKGKAQEFIDIIK
jgi:hypothetical protein